MSSKETALMSTPDPNPMISPIHRRLKRNLSAINAPITNEEAANAPQANERHTTLPTPRSSAHVSPLRVHKASAFSATERHPRSPHWQICAPQDH